MHVGNHVGTPYAWGGVVGANGTNQWGNQMFNMSYASNLFINGDLLDPDPGATYTLNLFNTGGGIKIIDWTLHKQGGVPVGFLLLTITGHFDETQWNLSPGFVGDGWSYAWMNNAQGHHQLWLFYANPTRIPEPSTYALLLGALAFVLLTLHRRRQTQRWSGVSPRR